MAFRSNQTGVVIICLLLVAAVWAVYLPVIWFDFTNYDDPDYVLENFTVLNGLTWQGIYWAFTHFHSGNWHPLTWVSHMLDCQSYGVMPAGHHVTNVLFHALNTLLLFGLLRFMTGALWASTAVATLFAVHPLHVESVAWISERKDVLSAFFGLLSLWAYAAYAKSDIPLKVAVAGSTSIQEGAPVRPCSFRSRSSLLYLSSLLLFALGLMSKPMLVTWPFVLLLLDYWPLGRLQPKGEQSLRMLCLEKLPFFVLSAAACVVTVLSQKSGAALAPLAAVPLDTRVLNALSSFLRYSEKLLWPAGLSVVYPDTTAPPLTFALLAGALLLIVTFLAWRFRTKEPYLLISWLWFLGTLVPVIGLVKVGSSAMADRYTYLPAIGFFILVVWGMESLSVGKRKIVMVLAGLAVFIPLTLVAQRQVLVWQNTETLFRHAVAVTKDNYIAQNSLAFYYADLGQSDLAERVFRTSLAINPRNAPAWNKLGSVMINQGRYQEAELKCQTALKINPRMTEAHTTLGLALIKQGKTNEALACYSDALRFKPDYAPAHYNLANALAHQGRLDLAGEHYKASLRSDPRSADAHSNLAYILRRQQNLDEAAAHFKSALHLRPGFWQARYGLGEVLLKQNRFVEASTEFSHVVQLKPDLALAHFQLALSLGGQGEFKAAIESAGQAHLLANRTGQQELSRKSLELRDRLAARNP